MSAEAGVAPRSALDGLLAAPVLAVAGRSDRVGSSDRPDRDDRDDRQGGHEIAEDPHFRWFCAMSPTAELTGRDLVAAGIVSERWPRLERELAEGLRLVAEDRPPEHETRAEVRAFRLEHRFLAAEDLRTWMAPRGLKIGDLNAVARRAVARRRHNASRAARGVPPDMPAVAPPASTAQAAPTAPTAPTGPGQHAGSGSGPGPAEIAAALSAEAVCTGALTEIGWWLADRLLSAAAGDVEVEPIGLERPRVQALVFAEACTVAGAASQESGLERAERLAWIAALDDAHRDWETGVAGAREIDRRLREHALDWCRFELDVLRLASPGAAAEAARQIAEGSDPRQVAATAGVPVAVRRLVLADAPPELGRTLAGAVTGDVPAWSQDGDEHVVIHVRKRTAPDPADGGLIARAREEVLADAVGQLRAGKVRWHDRA